MQYRVVCNRCMRVGDNVIVNDVTLPQANLGDIIWIYDYVSDMKVPMEVTRIYNDGSWDGMIAWTWGWA